VESTASVALVDVAVVGRVQVAVVHVVGMSVVAQRDVTAARAMHVRMLCMDMVFSWCSPMHSNRCATNPLPAKRPDAGAGKPALRVPPPRDTGTVRSPLKAIAVGGRRSVLVRASSGARRRSSRAPSGASRARAFKAACSLSHFGMLLRDVLRVGGPWRAALLSWRGLRRARHALATSLAWGLDDPLVLGLELVVAWRRAWAPFFWSCSLISAA